MTPVGFKLWISCVVARKAPHTGLSLNPIPRCDCWALLGRILPSSERKGNIHLAYLNDPFQFLIRCSGLTSGYPHASVGNRRSLDNNKKKCWRRRPISVSPSYFLYPRVSWEEFCWNVFRRWTRVMSWCWCLFVILWFLILSGAQQG